MSADKITAKILGDAKAECAKIAKNAKRDAERYKNEALEAAAEQAKAITDKARADCEENERRRMLTASLDARKNSLASRRKLLEAAFTAAFDKLNGLSDDRYKSLVCSAVLATDASGDEKVFVPEKDRKRFEAEKVLDALNAALKKSGRKGALSFGGATDKISSGALLVGEATDIDCSFEALLSSWREENESSVAGLLFGGKDDAVR